MEQLEKSENQMFSGKCVLHPWPENRIRKVPYSHMTLLMPHIHTAGHAQGPTGLLYHFVSIRIYLWLLLCVAFSLFEEDSRNLSQIPLLIQHGHGILTVLQSTNQALAVSC